MYNESIALRIHALEKRVTKAYEIVLAKHSLRMQEHGILLALQEWRGDTPTISWLAARIDLDPTTTGQTLKRLAERGFVSVTRPKAPRGDEDLVARPDGRERHVRITPGGTKLLNRARPGFLQAQRELQNALGPTEMGRFFDAIVRLDRALRNKGASSDKGTRTVPRV